MRVQSLGFRQANKCKCRENDKKLYMLQMQMQQNVYFLVCTKCKCDWNGNLLRNQKLQINENVKLRWVGLNVNAM